MLELSLGSRSLVVVLLCQRWWSQGLKRFSCLLQRGASGGMLPLLEQVRWQFPFLVFCF